MASPSARASRHLIRSDLRFAMAVMNAVVANQDQDETASWFLLSHIQYLSLVAYEVRGFSARDAAPTTAPEPWAHELALAASRHSNKLFNNTKKTQLALLAEFTHAAVRDREWYLDKNRAPWLVRALSFLGLEINDTAVLLHDGNILCTSHSIGFHAGLDPRAEREETVERARELASYISGLPDARDEDWSTDDYFRGWRSEVVEPKDTQYAKLYLAMFPGVPVAEAMALAILQVDLVSLKLMREMVSISDPLAASTFKFRFVGVWQIIQTLKAVAAPGADLKMPELMRDALVELLSSHRLEPMQTKGARGLRNVLVHYGLGSIDPDVLAWHEPLLGLPEHLLGAANWQAADEMLDEQIGLLLGVFGSWSGSYGHTLDKPH